MLPLLYQFCVHFSNHVSSIVSQTHSTGRLENAMSSFVLDVRKSFPKQSMSSSCKPAPRILGTFYFLFIRATHITNQFSGFVLITSIYPVALQYICLCLFFLCSSALYSPLMCVGICLCMCMCVCMRACVCVRAYFCSIDDDDRPVVVTEPGWQSTSSSMEELVIRNTVCESLDTFFLTNICISISQVYFLHID
jgi:hypothetical protein